MDLDIDAVERLLEGAAKAGAEKEKISAAAPPPAPTGSVANALEEKNEADKEKDKDKDRENSRGSRDKDRERDRERDRDRDRDRDRRDRDRDDRSRRRSRSPRDRDRRDRDRDRDYDRRDRDRDRGYRDRDRHDDRRDRDRDSRRDEHRDRDRERERDRGRNERDKERAKPKKDGPHVLGDSPPRPRKEDVPPSAAEDDRDERTVFVQNVPTKATDKEITDFFMQAGKVTDVRMISDKYSGKSKGFGYIEFETKTSIELALLLSGAPLRGQPVIVQQSQAEKNRAAAIAAAEAAKVAKSEQRDKPMKIYVGNLPANTTEELLRKTFSKYGEIDSIQFHTDDDGRCKGYSFLTFRKGDDARRCMKSGHGIQILGKDIEVASSHEAPNVPHKPHNQGMFGELDDEGGGLLLNAKGRVSLMKRLQRDEPAVPTTKVPTVPTPVVPTPCLQLSNMFDPAEEGPNFHVEIQEDVASECARFGQLLHIFVDPVSKGNVYLKFASTEAATAAFTALKGRYFSGRMLGAEYMDPRVYSTKFPGN